MLSKIDSFQDNYRFLSNFWPCTIQYDGMCFPSAENLYQALKCQNRSDRRQFTTIQPGVAKRLGRNVILREDWENIKIQVMTNVVHLKFSQNINLIVKLLETGDAILIEGNHWHDTFWGKCDGIGQNNLGKILMNERLFWREKR